MKQQEYQQKIRSQLSSSLFGGFRIQSKINQVQKKSNTPLSTPSFVEFSSPKDTKKIYQSPQLSWKTNIRSDNTQMQLKKSQSSFKSIRVEDTDDKQKSIEFKDKYYFESGKKILGQGAHAVVKLARRLIDDHLVAVKVVRSGDPEVISNFEDTFKNANFLRHPGMNVPKHYFLQWNSSTGPLYRVFKDLIRRINSEIPQSQNSIISYREWFVRKIAQKLSQVLLYIHERGVCHRDIKPDNILVNIVQQNEDGFYNPDTTEVQLKLIDFGVCKRFKQYQNGKINLHPKNIEMWTCTGNQLYCAPEIFEGGQYDEKIDVWALGIVIYQLLTNKLPFYADTVLGTIELIRTQELYLNGLKLSNLCQDFLRRVLQKDPKKRVTAQEMSQHPWLYNQKEIHSYVRRKLAHRQSTVLLEQHKQEQLQAQSNKNIVLSSNENVVIQTQISPQKPESTKTTFLLQYLDETNNIESESPLVQLSKIKQSIHKQKKPDQRLGEQFLNNSLVNRIRMIQSQQFNPSQEQDYQGNDSDMEGDLSDN